MIATDIIEALRYKLRCFVVPVEVPVEVFCDNKSVVNDSGIPISVLNNIHNDICYHRIREDQATGVIHAWWIPGEFNLTFFYKNNDA